MNKNIFNKGREKILECFYRNRDKSLYFSEILRETGLTQNTTLKHLKTLEENNILNSIKKTGNTFYKINVTNPQIYALFSYFDYRRLNELPSARKRAINEFLDKLNVKPLITLIFGSTAKNTFNSASDIDILMVFNKKEEDKKLKQEIEAITGEKLQTFIIDYSYFKEQALKQEDSLVSQALKTCFVVSGHNYFYKELLK